MPFLSPPKPKEPKVEIPKPVPVVDKDSVKRRRQARASLATRPSTFGLGDVETAGLRTTLG